MPLQRHSYHERDYTFGQAMLTLRASLGLTQANLAERLGVSRRALADWEGGLAYPKAEHLKAFLVLCVGASAFAAGREEEQTRALWRAARQKVLLDEHWLSELLGRPSPSQAEPAGGSSAVAAQGRAAAPEKLALWTVPYARNPYFTGRDELLSELASQFAPPASGQPTTIHRAALTQAQVIKGLGGIGKTQTAVEYAYRAREQGRYAHTFWISAASEETILTSFAALAERLPGVTSSGETDQRNLVAAVIRWLEQCKEPWLLIVDNADDLSMAQPYLPARGNGSILLTTRASAAGWLAPSLEVDAMGQSEAIELLLRRAQRFADATEEEIDEATNLVVALGRFPLALDQAGAYIEETGCGLRDYQELYQTHRGALLSRRGRQATGYPDTVATTWALSFEYVEKRSPAAVELLQLCVVLAPDHIPEELLTEGAPYWPSALQQAATDRFRFNQALETLLAFSLVKRLGEQQQISIHRLVQAVQQEGLTAEGQRQWAERLVRAVNVVFPREPREVASWPVCQRYLEQVQACLTLLQQQHLSLPEAAEVFDRAGDYLYERALYALVGPLYQQALHIWKRLEEPAGIARSLANLARLSYWQDRYDQSEYLHQQALALREQHLGSEHPDVAESLHDLAGLFRLQGKYTLAEPLYLRALSIREQQLGEMHLLVAETSNGLASLYQNQGKQAEAEPLYLRALSIREQRLGPEHPTVAESLHDLAVLYTSMRGKQAEVEPLSLRAWRIWEQQLGPEHPLVVYPLLHLALFYRKRGEYARAEPLYLRALHIRKQQLGEMHRNLIYPLTGLANLYREQGKYAQAEPLFQQALRICGQQLGQEHPLIAFTLDGLANLYGMQDKFTEAESLYQRALRIREQQLGQEHSDVALSLRGLANLYTRQGKYARAEPLFQRALRLCEQHLGPEHLETANVLHDFAGLQQAQSKAEEAVVLYQGALAIRENVLGADSPLTADTRERLQELLAAPGQAPESHE